MGMWFSLILILLLLSLCLPGAFLGAIVVFYLPIILGLIYMIGNLIGLFWFVVALMCIGLYFV